jgi:dipeptidyl aminopeptidase/acylaminoacyl peptidase
LAAAFALTALTGCHYFPDHHLVHPRAQPAEIVTWRDDVRGGALLIHVRGAAPPGPGPFPAVIVHPEGGKTADAMEGVIWDLAARGYFAVAADYERWIDGAYRHTLFTWRGPEDVTAIIDLVAQDQRVDPHRVAALGFSQGGVFSLLMAAYAPDRIRTVVAYYPVTDFPRWLNQDRHGLHAFAFVFVRWYFRREADVDSDVEYESMLAGASAYAVADRITAPVLLIHGERDTTAPVEESERMAARLRELGKPVELLVVPGAVHIFNFRQPAPAALAWNATTEWLAATLPGEGTDEKRERTQSTRTWRGIAEPPGSLRTFRDPPHPSAVATAAGKRRP